RFAAWEGLPSAVPGDGRRAKRWGLSDLSNGGDARTTGRPRGPAGWGDPAQGQDIVDFRLFQMADRPRIDVRHAGPRPARASQEGTMTVMPTTIVSAGPRPATEYTYRDRLLLVTRGSPLPPGATPTPSGVNFVLLCRHGTAVRLVLSEPCSGEVYAEIPLDPPFNRTGDHWHVRVDGLPEEFCYGYRVDGPRGDGHRFDPSIILHDPYTPPPS